MCFLLEFFVCLFVVVVVIFGGSCFLFLLNTFPVALSKSSGAVTLYCCKYG